MKAMIFAAGLGTRLRPLTDNKPKALVEVAGKPMLQRVIENLKRYGFDEIIINVHHFGQQIIDFVANNDNFGITVHISDERDELLDTGGGILKARQWLDGNEPFLVHNADILTDLNLKEFYDYHLHHTADATLLTKWRETARYLLFDDKNMLRGWVNKKTGATLPEGFVYKPGEYVEQAFGGIHVISPHIFDALGKFSTERKFSIIPFYVGECRNLKIMNYAPAQDYQWFDVGKIETIHQVEAAVLSKVPKPGRAR